jgi:hypothetical protein
VKKNPTTKDHNGEDVLKVPREIRFRTRYGPYFPLVIEVQPERQRRPSSNKANLAHDGPSLQGPQALLTAITRETVLVLDHVYATLGGQYTDYETNVDYDMIFKAISMKPKNPTGGDGGDTAGIHPLPWVNSPMADGSTTEFVRRLEECHTFMDRFAMHTPQYFINMARKKNNDPAEDSGDDHSNSNSSRRATTRKNKGAAKNPTTTDRAGGKPQGKKRKAPEVSDERLCCSCDLSSTCTLTYSSYQGLLLWAMMRLGKMDYGHQGSDHAPVSTVLPRFRRNKRTTASAAVGSGPSLPMQGPGVRNKEPQISEPILRAGLNSVLSLT